MSVSAEPTANIKNEGLMHKIDVGDFMGPGRGH